MKRYWGCLALLALAVSVTTGCGGGPEAENIGKSAEELNVTTDKADLKARLQEIAESGVAGSALAGMHESIEKLKASDPDLADELLAMLHELESASSESQIKSTAKKMADKL